MTERVNHSRRLLAALDAQLLVLCAERDALESHLRIVVGYNAGNCRLAVVAGMLSRLAVKRDAIVDECYD